MSNTSKKSLTFAAALICIVIYTAALIVGGGRVLANYNTRTALAEQEFNDVLDLAAGEATLVGFMTQAYQDEIKKTLMDSQTLLGIIISGSNGEFGFERQTGSVIEWFGNSPRFKTGFGIASEPFYKGIWIEGQRNTTVRATYSYIDYDLLIQVLKDTLFIVLLVVAFAVFVLILELNFKTKETAPARARQTSRPPAPVSNTDENEQTDDEDLFEVDDEETSVEEESTPEAEEAEAPQEFTPELPKELPADDDTPKGLYSQRGIGWESYITERLESELHRCAALEEDLVLINMETRIAKFGEETFRELCAQVIKFFTQRDMIFEKGEQGISLIIPAINLDQGFAKSEEFRNKIVNNLIDSSGMSPDLCIGLSSRAGRLVDAKRLMLEASSALDKAKTESDSPIIAFKSDPEKYRNYISRKMKG